MKIHYKKKQMNLNLILGLIWLVNGVFQTVFNEGIKWTEYFWFVISAFYLIIYFYQKKEKYLTIENGIVKQNWPFGKKMRLNEIKQIRHFAGEYVLKSEKKKIIINIELVEDDSLSELKTEFKKLNVKWI